MALLACTSESDAEFFGDVFAARPWELSESHICFVCPTPGSVVATETEVVGGGAGLGLGLGLVDASDLNLDVVI